MSEQPTSTTSKKRVIRARSAAPPSPAPAVVEALKTESPVRPVVRTISAESAPDSAASAALALAVTGARQETPTAEANVEPLKTEETSPPTAPGRLALFKRPAAQAAAVLVALGTGWLGAQVFATTGPLQSEATNRQWAETAQALRQGQNDVVRLTGDIKALKVAIESLKESVDRSKADLLTRQSQMMERIERSPGDAGARFAKVGEQLDRIETIAKDPGVKLAALTERFDRIERQMTPPAAPKPAAAIPAAAVPAAAVPAPVEGPAQTGSVETKPAEQKAARDIQLEGWVLHEVYDGVALIEGRNRRLYEVSQGGNIPGVGPVESIERRGKRWVVLTPKGFIGNER